MPSVEHSLLDGAELAVVGVVRGRVAASDSLSLVNGSVNSVYLVGRQLHTVCYVPLILADAGVQRYSLM